MSFFLLQSHPNSSSTLTLTLTHAPHNPTSITFIPPANFLVIITKTPLIRRGSVSQSHLETQSNAYATINKLPMAPASRRSLFNGSLDLVDGERDYATLDKSARSPLGPVVPGVTSTPISSTLPRRQQAGHSPPDTRGSNFFLNRDGEPQLVGNLS